MYEIETQLLISNDLNLIQKKQLNYLLQKLDSIIKMTSKFKSALK